MKFITLAHFWLYKSCLTLAFVILSIYFGWFSDKPLRQFHIKTRLAFLDSSEEHLRVCAGGGAATLWGAGGGTGGGEGPQLQAQVFSDIFT